MPRRRPVLRFLMEELAEKGPQMPEVVPLILLDLAT